MFSFLTSAGADRKRFLTRNVNGVWEEGQHNCFSCDKSFNFISRRHHCRQCGKECCSTCSALKVEGDRACIFCFVSLKEDVLAAVTASRVNSPPSKANGGDKDLSLGSDRSTLQSFVMNHSIVSLGDPNDDNNNNNNNNNSNNNNNNNNNDSNSDSSNDINNYNDNGGNDISSNSNNAQTPSKDREERIDTFVAPWSVSPSSAGNNSNNNSNSNSPALFASNSSSSIASTPIVALKTVAVTHTSNINENNENNENSENNENNSNSDSNLAADVIQKKDTETTKSSSISRAATIEADKENSVNINDS